MFDHTFFLTYFCVYTNTEDVECEMPGWQPCPSGSDCIPREWLCDGDLDCRDGSDEDEGLCNGNIQFFCIDDYTCAIT